jgi:hypothetical protein
MKSKNGKTCSCVCEAGYFDKDCSKTVIDKCKKPDFCSGAGFPALISGKVICVCDKNAKGECCETMVCNAKTKPPPTGNCKNGGVMRGGKCACPAWTEGPLCEKSTTPQGWDISRATNCNKRPLLSKDSPMQATWVRMQLGREDHISVFRPFKYGPLSKVKFFHDMLIGLDTPRFMLGAELQGSLSASVTFSAWLKMTGNFVLRAALIFSVEASKKTLDPTTMLAALMGGTDKDGNFHGNQTEFIQELYRKGDELRTKYPDMPISQTSRHLLKMDDDGHMWMSAAEQTQHQQEILSETDMDGRHPSQSGFQELTWTQQLAQEAQKPAWFDANGEEDKIESAQKEDNAEFSLSAEKPVETSLAVGNNRKATSAEKKQYGGQPKNKAYDGYATQSKHQGDNYNNARSTKKGKDCLDKSTHKVWWCNSCQQCSTPGCKGCAFTGCEPGYKKKGAHDCVKAPPTPAVQDCEGAYENAWTEHCVCGEGYRSKRFIVKTKPGDGGDACPPDKREACPRVEKQDCEWSSWSSWDDSGCGCNGGTMTRRRAKKTEANDCGKDCSGKAVETASCEPPKVVHCEWGEWSPWGKCKSQCGKERATRERKEKVLQNKCGKPCSGAKQDEKVIDCPYPEPENAKCEWGEWSDCVAMKACATTGEQKRNFKQLRAPNNCPLAKTCAEMGWKLQTKTCTPPTCPPKCEKQDCKWEWTSWGECDDPCGGFQTRTKQILAQPECNGEACPPSKPEKKKCGLEPFDCVADWSAWKMLGDPQCPDKKVRSLSIVKKPNECGKPCPKTTDEVVELSPKRVDCSGKWGEPSDPPKCGKGKCEIKFMITQPQNDCGKKCPEEGQKKTIDCQQYPEREDCKVTEWSPWGPACKCVKKGEKPGTQRRERRITQTPSSCPLSKPCPTDLTEDRKCPDNKCDEDPCEGKPKKDCKWDWSPWDAECSVPCGNGGKQWRRTIIKEQPECGGKACPNDSQPRECGDKIICCKWEWGQWTQWSRPKGPCSKEQRERKVVILEKPNKCCPEKKCPSESQVAFGDVIPPMDCKWTWEPWEEPPKCSDSPTKITRSRKISQQAICGGKKCETDNEYKTERSPYPGKLDCVEEWTPWSDCSSQCCGEKGKQTRTLDIKKKASTCPLSKPCSGKTESRSCTPPKPCKDCACDKPGARQDCKTDWGKWSACEYPGGAKGKCSKGKKTRTLEIIKAPECGGAKCKKDEQTAPCEPAMKPVDCEGKWSDWSKCKNGKMTKTFTITTKPNECGKPCDSVTEKTMTCETVPPCKKQDCVEEWGNWGACKCSGSKCGRQVGRRTRSSFIKTSPDCGGDKCKKPSDKEEACDCDCPETPSPKRTPAPEKQTPAPQKTKAPDVPGPTKAPNPPPSKAPCKGCGSTVRPPPGPPPGPWLTPEVSVSLRIDMPRGFGPSTFNPKLCGTPIDDFRFSNLAVYFASGDLSDSELDTLPGGGMGGINVKKGITLLAEWEMGKSCMFAPMRKVFSAFVLQVYGTLPFPGLDPQFSITASVGMTFPKKSGIVGAAVSITFTFGLGELEVELKGKIAVIQGGEQLEFEMTTTVGFGAAPPSVQLKVEADMIGCWKNAMKIPGFHICDVGLGLGVSMPAPTPIGIAPTYFRLQGGFIVGKLKFGARIEVDLGGAAGLLESGFLGFFKGTKLCIFDQYLIPIYMAQNAGLLPKISLPSWFQPPICFTQVILKASMTPITIAKEEFPEGLLFNATGYVFGKKFGMLINVGMIKAEAKAFIHNINLGPLSLTGLGCDLKKGTADDGVCFWFKFNVPLSLEYSSETDKGGGGDLAKKKADEAMKQFTLFFRFTGTMAALGFFKVSALMELSLKGMLISFQYWMVFSRASFMLSCGENQGAAPGASTDFRVQFEMWTEGLKDLGKKIHDGLDAFGKKANAAIDKANKSIKAAADKLAGQCRKLGMGKAPSDYSPAAMAKRKTAYQQAKQAADAAKSKERAAEKDAASKQASYIDAKKFTVSPGTGTGAPVVDKWSAAANRAASAEQAKANAAKAEAARKKQAADQKAAEHRRAGRRLLAQRAKWEKSEDNRVDAEREYKKNVVKGIQRIHDTAATHPRYQTLVSPVDGKLIKDKFDANNVEVKDMALLIELATEKGHFESKDKEIQADVLRHQMLLLQAQKEYEELKAKSESIQTELLADADLDPETLAAIKKINGLGMRRRLLSAGDNSFAAAEEAREQNAEVALPESDENDQPATVKLAQMQDATSEDRVAHKARLTKLWGHRWHVHHRHRPHIHHRHRPHGHIPHPHIPHRHHIHVPHRHHIHVDVKKIAKDARDLAAKKAKQIRDAAKRVADAAKRIKDKAIALAKKKWNEAKALAKRAADRAAKIARDAAAKAKQLKDAAVKSLKDAKDAAIRAAKAAARAAGKALKDAKDAAARLAKAALNKVVELAKAAALAIAKAACKALVWALDKVIAGAVMAVARAGVNAIVSAGKMVAKGLMALGGAIDNIFRVARMYYAGSLKQAVRGNFGRFEIDIYILKKKYSLGLTLDIKNLVKMLMDLIVKNVVKKIAKAIGL